MEEFRSEASRERKLKERAETYSSELEREIESLKRKHMGRVPTKSTQELSQEITRYKFLSYIYINPCYFDICHN